MRHPQEMGAAEVEAVMGKLLYGCGLRVKECLRLRVKDVDLSGGKVEIRGGKNDKDRVLTMPKSLTGLLEAQLKRCRVIDDLRATGAGDAGANHQSAG
jgi:site-specific recombinase XerD